MLPKRPAETLLPCQRHKCLGRAQLQPGRHNPREHRVLVPEEVPSREREEQGHFTFSSLGIIVSLGPSIVPSLLIVNTTVWGSIRPKSPVAMILSPSTL